MVLGRLAGCGWRLATARTLTNRAGPDRVLPANSLTTSWPDGAVEVRGGPHPSQHYPPTSVWTMLQNTLGRVPDRTALAVKRDGVWVKWSYRQYIEDIQTVAKGGNIADIRPSYSQSPTMHIEPTEREFIAQVNLRSM